MWKTDCNLYFIAVLLLAYMKGNANLCRAIVRAGARLGINNNQGINIFNYQVATKQLLFRLLGTHNYLSAIKMTAMHFVIYFNTMFSCICLDMLSKEPPWCDGSNCYECVAKFGVTTRKHHWLVLWLLLGVSQISKSMISLACDLRVTIQFSFQLFFLFFLPALTALPLLHHQGLIVKMKNVFISFMPQWLFIYIFKFKKDKLHGAKCDITAIFSGGGCATPRPYGQV